MSEIKKLKRGLEDVSPIFQQASGSPLSVNPGEDLGQNGAVEWVGVYSAAQAHADRYLAAFLASQFQLHRIHASVLAFQFEERSEATAGGGDSAYKSDNIRCDSVEWNRFLNLWAMTPDMHYAKDKKRQLVFIDSDLMCPFKFERVVPLLDKWILHVQANTESILECYRAVKRSISLNAHIEHYFMFDGKENDKRGEFLFEHLGGLMAQNLGIQLTWLGHLNLPQKGLSGDCRLELAHLFLKEHEDSVESLKKRVFYHQLDGNAHSAR